MIVTTVSGLQIMDFRTSDGRRHIREETGSPLMRTCGPLMRPASAASSSLVIPLSVLLYLEVTPDACPLLGRRQSLVPEAMLHHESCIYAWVLHFSTPPSLHSHNVSAVDELTGAVRCTCLDIRHKL